MIRILFAATIAAFLVACASAPSVTTIQEVPESADAPYDNVLVISLFKSFDLRRYLEREIVKKLQAEGIQAVASTSMMDTRTPVTRQTFRTMVDSLGSDAVLITQLVSLDAEAKLKDRRPESTYNVRPTYYFNVWSVELTEYVEPQALSIKHSLVLATQLFSVLNREPVWAIEVESRIAREFERGPDYSVIVDEATAITRQLKRDGLIAR